MALFEPPPPPRLRRNGRLRGMELAELLGVIIEMKIYKNYKNFEELLGNEMTSNQISHLVVRKFLGTGKSGRQCVCL